MSKATAPTSSEKATPSVRLWNALTSEWLEAMDGRGRAFAVSPLDALRRADLIHRLVTSNPLDLFAAHRFLLTLLYWKASDYGGVAALRAILLGGEVPKDVIESLATQQETFDLFDASTPFLQDPSAREAKVLSPAYLFAEMASGTNVAFFDHGDDEACRLCLRCATQGLARLVPWTQSGGSGKQPSIHGAPPIMVIAQGDALCQTLGLNLVEIAGSAGTPQWSGHFRPSLKTKRVSLMEALTWNPRRVHLLEPQPTGLCSRCGEPGLPTVGPIVYEKNEACKVDDEYTDGWRDPSAFYRSRDGKSTKTTNEYDAAFESDLRRLFVQKFKSGVEDAPESLVIQANPGHRDWLLVLPCTNPANNKSFDHRLLEFHGWPEKAPPSQMQWPSVPLFAGDPRTLETRNCGRASRGTLAFVRAASTLDAASWAIVAGAADQLMGTSVAAFDVFTSLYWPLRNREPAMPSREAAWLTLKLMATATASARVAGPAREKTRPWEAPARHQPEHRLRNGAIRAYPLRSPVGKRLETELREIIHRDHLGKPVDWAGLCQFIHDTLP
jgi:hypothetical protein